MLRACSVAVISLVNDAAPFNQFMRWNSASFAFSMCLAEIFICWLPLFRLKPVHAQPFTACFFLEREKIHVWPFPVAEEGDTGTN